MKPVIIFRTCFVLLACLFMACQTVKNDVVDTANTSDSETVLEEDTSEDTAIDEDEDTAEDQNEPENPLNMSTGCGSSRDALGSSIVIEDETRTFVLSLPTDYDSQTAYPLIFAWHGRGGSGMVAQSYFGLQEVVGSEAIIVYPDGLPQANHNGDTGWEVRASGVDIVFFDNLYEHMTENSCIDLDRVYSTGHSFGGFMTNFLGCQRGNILNAIAPVAGGGPWSSCQDSVAAILIHGNNDNIVELSEGESSLSKWKMNNDCSDNSTASSEGYCVSYEMCTNPVEWCEFSGGHTWPSFAAEIIWNFFLSL